MWRKTVLALVVISASLPAAGQNVSTYHGSASRDGNFVMPAFTWERARSQRFDTAFAPRFEGHLYAQPLYWKPPGGRLRPLDHRVRKQHRGRDRRRWWRDHVDRLQSFRGDTGERLFTSEPLAGLRHFWTLIAADNRLFVGADGRLYAFALP